MDALQSDVDERERPDVLHALLVSLGLYALWTAGTWFLEGRLNTLLRPEAAGARLAYALGINLLVGVGFSGYVLRKFFQKGVGTVERSGFEFGWRTLFAVAAGLVLGGGLYAVQGAPSWHPVVLANAFAQVLVVSTAEVLVCWAVVGNVVRESVGGRHRIVGILVASVVASALFGVYHFAHSPPFNTWSMVGLLSVVGLLTSAFYFVSRDIWGTIVFHNTLGVYGVVDALARQDALGPFETVVPPLFITATLTVAALAAVQAWLRHQEGTTQPRSD